MPSLSPRFVGAKVQATGHWVFPFLVIVFVRLVGNRDMPSCVSRFTSDVLCMTRMWRWWIDSFAPVRTWFMRLFVWDRSAIFLIRVVSRVARFSGACLSLHYVLDVCLGLFGDLFSIWASFRWFCVVNPWLASTSTCSLAMVLPDQEFFGLLFHSQLFLLKRALNGFLKCSLISIRASTFSHSCISSRSLVLILAHSVSNILLIPLT